MKKMTVEEEIRNQAEQARKTINERLHEFESSGYVRDFVAIRAISQFEKDVLGVVAKVEAERQKQLTELLKEFPTCEKCEVFTSKETRTSTARAIFCEGLRAVGTCPKDVWKEKFEALVCEGKNPPPKTETKP